MMPDRVPQDARPVRELPVGRVLDLLQVASSMAARQAPGQGVHPARGCSRPGSKSEGPAHPPTLRGSG